MNCLACGNQLADDDPTVCRACIAAGRGGVARLIRLPDETLRTAMRWHLTCYACRWTEAAGMDGLASFLKPVPDGANAYCKVPGVVCPACKAAEVFLVFNYRKVPGEPGK